MGVDLIEVDVRRRADGELVCSHGAVVAEGDALLLSAVLGLAAAAGVGAHLDVKEVGYEPQLVSTVPQLPRIWYTTPNEQSVRALRALGAPTLLTLGRRLRDRRLDELLRVLAGDAWPYRRIARAGALGVAVHVHLATPWLRRWCRRRGLSIMVWTVNDDMHLRRLLTNAEVSVVVTDRPGRALQLRDG